MPAAQETGRFQVILEQIGERLQVPRIQLHRPFEVLARLWREPGAVNGLAVSARRP